MWERADPLGPRQPEAPKAIWICSYKDSQASCFPGSITCLWFHPFSPPLPIPGPPLPCAMPVDTKPGDLRVNSPPTRPVSITSTSPRGRSAHLRPDSAQAHSAQKPTCSLRAMHMASQPSHMQHVESAVSPLPVSPWVTKSGSSVSLRQLDPKGTRWPSDSHLGLNQNTIK